MSSTSEIEWTDATWNPVTGCDKISTGCAHCYAEKVALRFWAKTQAPMLVPTSEGETSRPRVFTDVQCHPERLEQPLRWKKPRRIFVNSMSDLFHDDVPDAFIDQVFAVMALAQQHTFQVLTKRADRMLRWFDVGMDNREHEVGTSMRCLVPADAGLPEWPLPNVWLGVSVENQRFADERITKLLEAPAAVRFVSYEPALGCVDLKHYLPNPMFHCCGCGRELMRDHCDKCGSFHNTATNAITGLDWVIVGGESGRGARPFHVEWARDVLRQCRKVGVAFFMKQLGASPYLNGRVMPLASRKGSDMAEWPEDLRVREMPI